MGTDQPPTGRKRVTVAEASALLGVTVEAVRGRIKRGTLEHERDSGTVYVLLPADQASTSHQPDDDQTTDHKTADRGELADELRDRIRYLERQVEEEREARRRADTLLAQLMQRIPELEARESPVSSAEASEGAEPRSAAEGQHAATERPSGAAEEHDPTLRAGEEKPRQRRSLWRWILGGGS